MPKCYILVNKGEELYETIPENFTKVFCFDSLPSDSGYNSVKSFLENILDNASTEEDYLILNGPAWLTAIGGYIWLSQEDRKRYNFMVWSGRDQRYVKKNMEIT